MRSAIAALVILMARPRASSKLPSPNGLTTVAHPRQHTREDTLSDDHQMTRPLVPVPSSESKRSVHHTKPQPYMNGTAMALSRQSTWLTMNESKLHRGSIPYASSRSLPHNVTPHHHVRHSRPTSTPGAASHLLPSTQTPADPAVSVVLILLGVMLAPLVGACAVYSIPKQALFSGLVVVAFFALNSGLSLLNRWALMQHGLQFPLTMTAMHMLFGSFALSPLMLLHPDYLARHVPLVRHEWRKIVAIGVLNGLQISANNSSLTRIELSLNQVIRAFGPVCVASLALLVEGKRIPFAELLTLLAITAGVWMTVHKGLHAGHSSSVGVALTMISIFMQSAILYIAGHLTTNKAGKMDAFQVTFYTGPVAFVTLLPMVVTETSIVYQSFHNTPVVAVAFLLTSCCLAVCYNVVVFQATSTLSPIGTAVLANTKIVLLVVLAALLLGETATWTGRQFFGCIVSFGGVAYYSYLKLADKQEAARCATSVADAKVVSKSVR